MDKKKNVKDVGKALWDEQGQGWGGLRGPSFSLHWRHRHRHTPAPSPPWQRSTNLQIRNKTQIAKSRKGKPCVNTSALAPRWQPQSIPIHQVSLPVFSILTWTDRRHSWIYKPHEPPYITHEHESPTLSCYVDTNLPITLSSSINSSLLS
jgi:hypothetical protein